MQTAAIIEWLRDEFTKRLQQKEGECLTTLVWFDPNRYWLPSMPRLMEAASAWTVSTKEGDSVPMGLVAVGGDIPGGAGKSPLQIRLDILADREQHRGSGGRVAWGRLKRWVIYCPYPPEWLIETERPRKSLPFSWLMPFCAAGLDWGRGGGDEDKLPSFLRGRGVDITKDRRQLTALYLINQDDRSRSPLARLVARSLDKPLEFWGSRTWDLKSVQDELLGDINRQIEELLVAPESAVARMMEQGTVEDFLARIEEQIGMKIQAENLRSNPAGFCRDLVRFVALAATWRNLDFDQAFPFISEQPPPYKTERCSEIIGDWFKVPEVAGAYVGECRTLEKEGLNLSEYGAATGPGHVLPHLILDQWHRAKALLQEASKAGLQNLSSVLSKLEASAYDKIWDSLLPGELGWRWLDLLKDMERRMGHAEAWLARADTGDFEESLVQYADSETGWWHIDDRFRTLMIRAVDDPEGDLIKDLSLSLYTHWIKISAGHFSFVLTKRGNLDGLTRVPAVQEAAAGVWKAQSQERPRAVLFMDALRYDLAMAAGDLLRKSGFRVSVRPCLAGLPSKTEVGMSLLLPECVFQAEVREGQMVLKHQEKDLGKKENRLDYLRACMGEGLKAISLQDLSAGKIKELGAKILVVFSRDIDADGEAKGLGLLKDVEKEITELVQKVKLLVQTGYHEVHVLTDHGFLLSSSEDTIKWEKPQGARVCDRRFAVVEKSVGTDLPAISLPWDDDYWLVLPPAGTVFKAPGQLEFLHGGASFQEMVIPHIHVEPQEQVVRISVRMIVEQETIDSGVVKVTIRGETPTQQLSLAFMPTTILPRAGQLCAERAGKPFSKPKPFEVGPGDHLKLSLFLERGLKKGDLVTITARDKDELLATKELRVIRDV
jgi:hypothetical protein